MEIAIAMPTMGLNISIGYVSACGRRSINEDFVAAREDAGGITSGNASSAHQTGPSSSALACRASTKAVRTEAGVLACIADGVSTGGGGLEAAQTTVIGLINDFFCTPAHWATSTALDRLIHAQNAWLVAHNKQRAATQGHTALTTLTALVLRGQRYTLAHVGDTRAWRLREGDALTPLTQDHAFDHVDMASRLTRAVGLSERLVADFVEGPVQAGDCFLLTTDGVHGSLKPAQMATLVRQAAQANEPTQAAADALVGAALAAGSRDNATALVLKVHGLGTASLQDEAAYMLERPTLNQLRAGDLLDGYRIEHLVADNGVHRLYKAQAADGAAVALKLLHPARASDSQERLMLAREAWLSRSLATAAAACPALVPAHSAQASASAPYVVFDWLAGHTLGQRLAQTARLKPAAPAPSSSACAPALLSVEEAAACGKAIASALAQLHRLGAVHRDVKPGNVHQGEDGQWRLLDLGSASFKQVCNSALSQAAQEQQALKAGTPSYMNPEQWKGESANAASDLFALGATLYQGLTGHLPYGEIEPFQLARYRRDPPSAARLRPDVPMWLAHLLAKALARDKAHRFETAEEMLLAFERGAARTVAAPPHTPLLKRDSTALWKMGLVVSLLLNVLLVVWVLFLPR